MFLGVSKQITYLFKFSFLETSFYELSVCFDDREHAHK